MVKGVRREQQDAYRLEIARNAEARTYAAVRRAERYITLVLIIGRPWCCATFECGVKPYKIRRGSNYFFGLGPAERALCRAKRDWRAYKRRIDKLKVRAGG